MFHHVSASFLFKAESYSLIGTDHILFIHLSVSGHLGGFCLLATVNNAAVNMGVQIPLEDPAFNSFEYRPRSVISGSHGSSTLIFKETPYCFPQQLHPFTFPTSSAQGLQFLPIRANTCEFLLFGQQPS